MAEYIPKCKCQTPAYVRPNILLYNDCEWNTKRFDEQERNFSKFMNEV